MPDGQIATGVITNGEYNGIINIPDDFYDDGTNYQFAYDPSDGSLQMKLTKTTAERDEDRELELY